MADKGKNVDKLPDITVPIVQLQPSPQSSDEPVEKYIIPLDGKWYPAADAAQIGKNFTTLTNLRYADGHPEGILGMTKINTTALTTYLKIPSAFHFRKYQPAETHLLVQAYNAGITASQILQNTYAIPTAGDFSGTALFTESVGTTGRFSDAPGGQVAYCNGTDSCIWGGVEMRVAACITSTAAITTEATNKKDYSDIINNTKTDIANCMIIGTSSSVFPPAQSLTYVNATTYTADYQPYCATDPVHSLTGAGVQEQWKSTSGTVANQRFHIDLGAATIIKRIYYENFHVSGTETDCGAQNFTFWGSNEASAFAELTYATDTNWTELTVSSNAFAQHTASNVADPKQITVTNTTAYRYYAVKIVDNFGDAAFVGLRRIELSTSASNDTIFALGSPRPLQGIKIYINSANLTSSTLTGRYWDGAAWATNTLTDNTDTGASLAVTGTVTFASTVDLAKPRYLEGYYLYWYDFTLSAGQASIYKITLDAPFQNIIDLWDGVFRQIASFYVTKASALDNTLNVRDDIYDAADSSTWADVSSLIALTQYLEVGFTEKASGVLINIPSAFAQIAATVMTVDYWDGTIYTSVGAISDGTSVGGVSLARSGVVSWTNNNLNAETKKVIAGGYPLYYYRIKFSVALDATTYLYYLGGITAHKKITGYRFPLHAADRLILCCNNQDKKNTILISAQDRPDVFNGVDSYEIEIGTESGLNCATSLANQYASGVYNYILAFKDDEVWKIRWEQLVTETTWERFRISSTVGCAAITTLCAASVTLGEELSSGKMIAIWRGTDGIYISDGQTPMLVSKDIANVFDQSKTPHVNLTQVGGEQAFIQQVNGSLEYHWLWASGTGTTNDKEYVLDLRRWKWFEIDRGTGLRLRSGVDVMDTDGNKYAYGFIDTGYMERLDYGTAMNTGAITCTLQTGDQLFAANDPLTETELLRVNLISIPHATTTAVTVTHYLEGATSGTDYAITIANTTHRISNVVTDIFSAPAVFHSIKLVWTSSTDAVKFIPMMISAFYRKVRDHIRSTS